MTATADIPVQVHSTGTRLRLRALVAMGHSQARLSRALGRSEWLTSRIINGGQLTVPPDLRADAEALYDAWWNKRPPETTPAERKAAAAARARARRCEWVQPMALDDDELDLPGYQPQGEWRPATGTGVAHDPYPLGVRRPA